MSRPSVAATLTLAAMVFSATPALAQQNETAVQAESAPSSSIVTTTPTEVSEDEAWLQSDLEAVQQRVRRRRIATISMGAAMTVGVILSVVPVSLCENPEGFQLECQPAARPLWITGFSLFSAGFFGIITAGVMLRNAKKKKREIERDLRRIQYGRRLQWDASSGGFVF
jgi:hypothetical protein